MLEKTLESLLDNKEIQPVHPKGDHSWIFIGRTDAKAETPILWPPDAKNWLIRKDPDAETNWRQEKRATEDETVGWHRRLKGKEFDQAPGVDEGQGSLACCSPRGRKDSDTTEQKRTPRSPPSFPRSTSLTASPSAHGTPGPATSDALGPELPRRPPHHGDGCRAAGGSLRGAKKLSILGSQRPTSRLRTIRDRKGSLLTWRAPEKSATQPFRASFLHFQLRGRKLLAGSLWGGRCRKWRCAAPTEAKRNRFRFRSPAGRPRRHSVRPLHPWLRPAPRLSPAGREKTASRCDRVPGRYRAAPCGSRVLWTTQFTWGLLGCFSQAETRTAVSRPLTSVFAQVWVFLSLWRQRLVFVPFSVCNVCTTEKDAEAWKHTVEGK